MVFMLTTIDNPYSPFSDYDEWYNFDVTHGYNTCAYLDRIAITSNELSDIDQDQAIDQAMNEIIGLNLSGKHIKITEEYKPRMLDTVE